MTNKSKCVSGSFLSGGHTGRHHGLCSFKIALRVINTHRCSIPMLFGFLSAQDVSVLTSILCTDVLYTVHNTSVCYCRKYQTNQSLISTNQLSRVTNLKLVQALMSLQLRHLKVLKVSWTTKSICMRHTEDRFYSIMKNEYHEMIWIKKDWHLM